MKVYVLGDSISIHYGPYLQEALRGIMDYARKEGVGEALLDLADPQGATGGDSARVLEFLRNKAAEGGIDADILLLNCGLHDLRTDPATGRKQVPLAEYERNLRSILDVVRAMRPKPVWIRTTPCDERAHNRPGTTYHRFAADCAAYNEAADRVMAEAGVPTIDLFTFTLGLGPDLYCDHVHFREPIRRRQGEYIAQWLVSRQQDR